LINENCYSCLDYDLSYLADFSASLFFIGLLFLVEVLWVI